MTLVLKEHAVKKGQYTEEKIAYALKQAEAGTPVAEVLRRMVISEQTFYRWKKLYGGLGVGELRRLRVRTHSQNRTVAARATADRKTVGHLS